LARYAANWGGLTKETPRFFRDFDGRLSQLLLQNFHHQTNGFSDLSANLYDLQVEILFGGSADPMRRRIIALTPWAESFDSVPESQMVLDVACGTGRTLKLSVALCLKHLFWYRFVTRLLA